MRRSQKSIFLIIFGTLVLATAPMSPVVEAGEAMKRHVTDGSDVGVQIMGTIAQKDSANNVALVKIKSSGQVAAVKPGFTINDLKVEEVKEKYLVLSRGGQLYMVYHDKFATEFAGSDATPNSNPVVSAFLAGRENFSEDGFERKKGNVAMSAAYRNKVVNEDLGKILMQATAEPYMQNGQIAGFQLSQIDPGSIFDKGGIQNSDIITQINGQNLNNIAGAIALLRSLKSAPEIDVEVLRNGQPTKIQLKVSE